MDMQPILNNDSKDGMMLSLRNDEFQPLLERWNAMKDRVEKEAIDLNPLFIELEKHVRREDDLLRLAANTDYALKESLIIFINKLLDQFTPTKSTTPADLHTPLNNEDLLEEAAALVKALDKNNSKRSEAGGHLSFGFFATFCGVIITVIADGLLATFAPAIVPAMMAALFTPLAPVAAAIGLAIASGLFLSALVVSIVQFKKAYNRFNKPAPEGLALALAKALPALAEKVHYGNEEETKRAKIENSRQKLFEFYRMETQDYGRFKEKGQKYYQNRLAFLRGQTTDKPSKVSLLQYKNTLSAEKDVEKLTALKIQRQKLDEFLSGGIEAVEEKYGSMSNKEKTLCRQLQRQLETPMNTVSESLNNSIDKLKKRIARIGLVNDHRTNAEGNPLPGATLKLKDSLKGTLFAEHYDVKHAMKVEEAVRDKRRAKAARV